MLGKKPSTYILYINYFLSVLYWFYHFNLETWCEKCVLRLDIHWVKYAKTWASSDPYFLVYDSVHMRENTDTILSIYGKIRLEKARISAFYAVVKKK